MHCSRYASSPRTIQSRKSIDVSMFNLLPVYNPFLMHAPSLAQFTSMTSKSSRKNNSSAVRTAPLIEALTFVLFILHAGCIKCTVVKLNVCTHIMWVTEKMR